MKKFKIYRNYGCLSAEKRVKYTYGTEAGKSTKPPRAAWLSSPRGVCNTTLTRY